MSLILVKNCSYPVFLEHSVNMVRGNDADADSYLCTCMGSLAAQSFIF